MEIKLVTDATGLEALIKALLEQKNKVIGLFDTVATKELAADLAKANRRIAIKDADPKATEKAMDSKVLQEFEAEDKELLAQRKLYKEAEAELECLENQLSCSKKLIDIMAK